MTDPVAQLAQPAPKFALCVTCAECGQGTAVILPTDLDVLTRALAQHGWFVATLTPPGQDPVVFGVLCGPCAPKVFPPEVLKKAEEHRQKIVAGGGPR